MGPYSLLILSKRRRCKILHSSFNWHETVLRAGESREGDGRKKILNSTQDSVLISQELAVQCDVFV